MEIDSTHKRKEERYFGPIKCIITAKNRYNKPTKPDKSWAGKENEEEESADKERCTTEPS